MEPQFTFTSLLLDCALEVPMKGTGIIQMASENQEFSSKQIEIGQMSLEFT
jgi:hypothetical protein